MFNALRTDIGELHRANRANLEDDCDALKIRIDQSRREGRITEEPGTSVACRRNPRSSCRGGSQMWVGTSEQGSDFVG
jgi:hypothetical protein